MLRRRNRGPDLQRRLQLSVTATLFIFILLVVPLQGWSHSISSLSWDHDSDGHTVVTVVSAHPIAASSVRYYHLTEPPRAVTVLAGIGESMEPGELHIEDRFIDRVRLVLHEDRSPPELLLVFDLVRDAARILSLDHDNDRLVIVIGVPGPEPTSLPTVSAPSATAVPIPRPPTPTATPSPPPSPSPTATTTSVPTTMPTYPDRPAPPVLPPAAPTSPASPASPTPAPPRQIRELATPTPGAPTTTASRAVDVTTSQRGDGSTLLRITADGRLPQGCSRYLEVAGEPARIVVTIRGISAPELPRSLDIGDPNIDRIRIIHDAETSEGELHFVLLLNDPGITVSELKQVGPHVVVLVAPVDP